MREAEKSSLEFGISYSITLSSILSYNIYHAFFTNLNHFRPTNLVLGFLALAQLHCDALRPGHFLPPDPQQFPQVRC